jgi:hypothetical protein
MRLTPTSRQLKMVTAVAIGVTGLLALPSAAFADNGDRTTVIACPNLNALDQAGVSHAEADRCSVTWGKNIYNGDYWQIASMRIIDSKTDGYCAHGTFSDGGSFLDFSECNGNWYSRTQRFDGPTARFAISVKAGLRNGIWQWDDETTINAPSGY